MKYTLSPQRLLELATIEGARQLGLGELTSSLTPGKRADLLLLCWKRRQRWRLRARDRSPVDTVMIDGRFVRRQGQFTGVDASEIVRDAEASARRIARLV